MNTKKAIRYLLLWICLLISLCMILYKPFTNLFEDPQALRSQLQSYGILGQLILSLTMALQVLLAFLPGEIIEIMAGYIYGPYIGFACCMLGSAIGSSLIFIFIKKWGIHFIKHFINIDKINEVKCLQNKENRNIILFIIFFIPGTPKDILTYFMPLTDMKLSTFLIITTFARFPSIIASTVGGHAIGIENYSFSILVFLITGIVSLIGLFIYKKIIHKPQTIYHL